MCPVDRHAHPVMRSLKRWTRERIWSRPGLYQWLFELRYTGRDQFRPDGIFWVVGFQRSGNTFAGLLLDEVLFPGRVDFHLHVSTSLRVAVETGKPGLFVIRKPLDAAISVAIFHHWPLVRALEDYIDLHRFWLRDAPHVPVAPFEWFTRNPSALVAAAAGLADLTLAGDPVTPDVLDRVRVRTEELFTARDGSLNECQVARPSVFRTRLQHQISEAAQTSPRVQRLIATAESIRREFLARSVEGCSPGVVDGVSCADMPAIHRRH